MSLLYILHENKTEKKQNKKFFNISVLKLFLTITNYFIFYISLAIRYYLQQS